MNIANVLGKAQNVIKTFKGKGSELKGMIEGLKNNQESENLSVVTRSSEPIQIEEQEKPKNNMFVYLAIGAVVLFMLMKKK